MSGDRSGRLVVVVGTSGAADTESTPRRCAALVEDLAGAHAQMVIIDPDTPQQARAELSALPAEVGALFLPDASHDVACQARALMQMPVLTGQDTTAIALAAAVSTTLARAGRAPRSSQVVIAGADTLPILCPLLMVGGAGTVTTWNPSDAHAFPLHRVTSGTDVVIDLLDTMPDSADGFGPVVIRPDREHDTALVLPGLVRAILQAPGARLDIEVHHACALALVMGTPPEDMLPRAPDRELTDRVAAAAFAALRADHPFETNPG
jgi:malic enzyme